jgi:hypothetical protein
MKQTAVEWLVEQFNLQAYIPHIEQAKEMEKQQIVIAFISGDNSDCTQDEDALLYALSYYNETFKK